MIEKSLLVFTEVALRQALIVFYLTGRSEAAMRHPIELAHDHVDTWLSVNSENFQLEKQSKPMTRDEYTEELTAIDEKQAQDNDAVMRYLQHGANVDSELNEDGFKDVGR